MNLGTLPNLIIIGAQKCATTSLHYYLSLHPQIYMSNVKEINFFVEEYEWKKGTEWYKSNFKGKADVYGESSPAYTHYPFFNGVPEKMYSTLPQVKLIYILRDPIDRIISNYIHEYSARREHGKLSDALNDFDNNPYVTRSKYYMQLEQYLNYFPKSSILVITLEDLKKNARETMRRVFGFSNVDDSFYSQRFISIRHKSNDKRRKNRYGLFLSRSFAANIIEQLPSHLHWHAERLLYLPFSSRIEEPGLDKTLRKRLADHLRNDVENLRNFTGDSFEFWSL